MKALNLLFLFVIAWIFVSCVNETKSNSDNHRYKTLLLRTTGEAEAQPDEASISIHLQCIDKNIKASKECLIKKSEELNKLISGHGVAEEDILTTSINQSKEYRWVNNSNVFQGYRSSITTLITVRELDVLEKLYTALLQNENISINNLSFAHSQMDSLEHMAYENALDKANALADKILAKAGNDEKEILRIGNVELPATTYYPEVANDAYEVQEQKAKAPQIRINNGKMFVIRELMVEYRIK